MSPNDMRQVALAILRGDDASDDWKDWTALLCGGFSLVDHFDRDGRRYLIAERRAGKRSVSTLESRMLAARARGTALKVIAYELGVSVPAVSRNIRRAMSVLGIRNQSELARVLGSGIERA